MKIESWPASRPIAYARNPRKIPQKAVDKVAASIQEFGFRQPIVVDKDGVIVVGHTRLQAAQKLGMAKVPVHVAAELTPAQAKAYRLADNRDGQESTWDDDLLGLELGELGDLDFDLSLTGFDPAEIDAHTAASEGLTDEDAAPALPSNPVTKPGDVWRCGGHRVLCGDATSADDVAKLLAGVEPHLMVTDPPYGVNYDPAWRDGVGSFTDKTVMRGKVANDDRADWTEAWVLFPGNVAYVWHGGLHSSIVVNGLTAANFEIRSQIIWVKQHFAMSRGHYHWMHEPCWYAVRKNAKGDWAGGRKQTTVWQISSLNPAGKSVAEGDDKLTHGTQKPVECMRRPIVNNSSPGQAVYDPFLGSGTTMIAAETERRVCLGLEIDPSYCDVIVKRWQDFTGDAATLESDGRTFSAVAADQPYDPEEDSRASYDHAIEEKRKEFVAETSQA